MVVGDYESVIWDGDGCGRLWECDIRWGWETMGV